MKQTNYLSILDVGHGNSAVLADGERIVVIDTGLGSGLLSFLKQQEIDKIDVILLSHADADHIGGLVAVLATGEFHIGEIRVNPDASKGSQLWDDLMYELHLMNRQNEVSFITNLTTTDSGAFDSINTKLEIVAPNSYLAGKGVGSHDRNGKKIESNSLSVVIRVIIKDDPVALFCADLDDVGLAQIVNDGIDISAPILVFPHHGGYVASPSATKDYVELLLSYVQPKRVIFSIGRTKTRIQLSILHTVKTFDRNIWISCTQLSTRCSSLDLIGEPTHLSSEFSAGREMGYCCIGTVMIPFASIDAAAPSRQTHTGFVNAFAPTAMCIDSAS